MPTLRRALCASLSLALAACAGAPPSSNPATPMDLVAGQLSGCWIVTLREKGGTELDVRMTCEVTKKQGIAQWEAYSRPGGAREILGSVPTLLGRTVGALPPREALMHIAGGSAEGKGDVVTLTGTLVSPVFGKRALAGTLVRGRLHADLARASGGDSEGTFDAVRATTESPLGDYRALAADVQRAISDAIYDPSLPSRPEYRRFFSQLEEHLSHAQDDLDAVAWFHALVPTLGISHLNLERNPRLAATPVDEVIKGDPKADPNKLVRLSYPAPGIAWLRVYRWIRVEAVIDDAFARLDASRPNVLILDVCGNPGGDASSMAPAAHLWRDATPVGVLLGRSWYKSHSGPPVGAELEGIPVISSEGVGRNLFDELHRHGAVLGRVTPKAPYFDGAVYLLVDGGTGSASEALAHALKVSGRATLVGSRTAGAMLTALPHALRDGWVITIPEADFFAADGTRIEGKGVQPDLAAGPDGPFLVVADQLKESAPYSSAVLRAGSLESLKRPAEAERAYREALSVADKQNPLPGTRSRANVHKRIALILKGRGDHEAARNEYAEVLKFEPEDADAKSALRQPD